MESSNTDPIAARITSTENPADTNSPSVDRPNYPSVKSEAIRKRVPTPFSSPKATKGNISSTGVTNKTPVDTSLATGPYEGSTASITGSTETVPSSSATTHSNVPVKYPRSPGRIAGPGGAAYASSSTSGSMSSKGEGISAKKSTRDEQYADAAIAKKKEEVLRSREERRKRSTIAWFIIVVAFIGIVAGVATLIIFRARTMAAHHMQSPTPLPNITYDLTRPSRIVDLLQEEYAPTKACDRDRDCPIGTQCKADRLVGNKMCVCPKGVLLRRNCYSFGSCLPSDELNVNRGGGLSNCHPPMFGPSRNIRLSCPHGCYDSPKAKKVCNCPKGMICSDVNVGNSLRGSRCVCDTTDSHSDSLLLMLFSGGCRRDDSFYNRCSHEAEQIGLSFGTYLIGIAGSMSEQARLLAEMAVNSRSPWSDDIGNFTLLAAAIDFQEKRFPNGHNGTSYSQLAGELSDAFSLRSTDASRFVAIACKDKTFFPRVMSFFRNSLGEAEKSDWIDGVCKSSAYKLQNSDHVGSILFFLLNSLMTCDICFRADQVLEITDHALCVREQRQRAWATVFIRLYASTQLVIKESLWNQTNFAEPRWRPCIRKYMQAKDTDSSYNGDIFFWLVSKINECMRVELAGPSATTSAMHTIRTGLLSNPSFTFYNRKGSILNLADPVFDRDGKPLPLQGYPAFDVKRELNSYLTLIEDGAFDAAELLPVEISVPMADGYGVPPHDWHPPPLIDLTLYSVIFPKGLVYLALRLALIVHLSHHEKKPEGFRMKDTPGAHIFNPFGDTRDLEKSQQILDYVRNITNRLMRFHAYCVADTELIALSKTSTIRWGSLP